MTQPQESGVPFHRQELRSLKLGEQVARIVVRRLTKDDGTAITSPTEQEICDEFGVSKTVAREVMGQLVSMRLVNVRHGRRMIRREPSEWNYLHPVLIDVLAESDSILGIFSELHDVRLLIEPEVAARAAIGASPAQIGRMDELVSAMHGASDDPDAYLALDVKFHSELVAAAENRILSHVVDSIGELLRASRRVSNLLPQATIHATEGHEAILKAVKGRDPDGARQAMRTHLEFAAAAWAENPAKVRRAG